MALIAVAVGLSLSRLFLDMVLLVLALGALGTFLRVRSSPAFKQTQDQVVLREPGQRLLGPPQPALPEAEKDLDFALLSQAAYDQTPHGQKHREINTGHAEAALESRGWSMWPTFGESRRLPEKLENAHLRAQVWINRAENAVAVTFGGTVLGNEKDWKSNLRWFLHSRKDEYTETVRVFGPAFVEEFVKKICMKLPHPERVRLYSTGHSLGGGLAQQFAYSLPLSPDVPRVCKVFAFDPSPVTGYFSVEPTVRHKNEVGLFIDRIYERGEILAYARSITNFIYLPSKENPTIRQIRYYLFKTINPVSGHSITELAGKLWDLLRASGSEPAQAPSILQVGPSGSPNTAS
jgi:hypothetical protein